MQFRSILFPQPNVQRDLPAREPPAFFRDLRLDQVVAAITADWKDYDLAPFYYNRTNDLDVIAYRQEVMQDLAERTLLQAIRSFSERMRTVRNLLDQVKNLTYYKYALERRFLGAADIYCADVEQLLQTLNVIDPKSRGFAAFRDYLAEYVASPSFVELQKDLRKLKADLAAIQYCLFLKNGSVTVQPYNSEIDYSAAVEEAFAKFRHEAPQRYGIEIPKWEGMNHIEEQILYRVALLHPDTFSSLDAFFTAHAGFMDDTISQCDREIQFYVAYLSYIAKFERAGLQFCRPELSRSSKEIGVREGFDLALAGNLLYENASIVTNDFYLRGPERILIVSGPNQGGKTTLARTFGQLHYLASLGCPVPAREARLYLCDRLFTHFEREEQITNLRGKLQDDLVRIRQILDEATPDSVLIMNEMFSSTSFDDALYLSKEIMAKISTLDLIGAWVTFLDELASFNDKTVSMVASVNPDNPAVRTFKLQRKRADGLAYALAIAEKHHVTYEWLRERIKV